MCCYWPLFGLVAQTYITTGFCVILCNGFKMGWRGRPTPLSEVRGPFREAKQPIFLWIYLKKNLLFCLLCGHGCFEQVRPRQSNVAISVHVWMNVKMICQCFFFVTQNNSQCLHPNCKRRKKYKISGQRLNWLSWCLMLNLWTHASWPPPPPEFRLVVTVEW